MVPLANVLDVGFILRKIIGLFVIVQGFEASRYIGVRFGQATRISTMRVAQAISTIVFVVFVASVMVMFPPGSADAGS